MNGYPVFPLAFEEIGTVSPEALAALAGPPLARLALLVMRAARAGDVLEALECGPELLRSVRGALGGSRGLRMIVSYTLLVRGEPREVVERMGRILEGEPGLKSAAQELIEQGMEKGRERGARQLLERLLRARFHAIAPDVVARLAGASRAELELWAERVVTVATIEDVFRA